MNKFAVKQLKRAFVALFVFISLVACAALFAGCDDDDAFLPDDAEWVFDSLVVTTEDSVTTYSVAISANRVENGLSPQTYLGMTVDENMVTAEVAGDTIVLTFANGSDMIATWKRTGNAGTTSMIEYSFIGHDTPYYGACGYVDLKTADGGVERTLTLCVAAGERTFYFVAA